MHVRSLRRHVALLAILAPFVPMVVLMGYVVFGWAAASDPLWPVPALNVTEAAFVRDHAEAVRLIRAGQDPNAVWPVRAELRTDSDPRAMRPVEAAIRIRRVELVQLLMREGVRIPSDDIPGLVALAEQSSAPDIAEYLRTSSGQ